MQNLDLECAKLGRELSDVKADDYPVDEKVFTTALSVLEEQGPYACFLYLQALEGNAGQTIAKRTTKFLKQFINGDTNANKPLEFLKHVASDLDNLLFARDLLRQAFVYARYHAKTRAERAKRH